MIFTIDEIKNRVKPVAEKYDLRAVYVVGSYARNEADSDSDVDILVDRTGSNIKKLILQRLKAFFRRCFLSIQSKFFYFVPSFILPP